MVGLVGLLTEHSSNMATIFLKGSDKTCILAVREGMQRRFDFGDWTEVRLGIMYSFVPASNDDAASTVEVLSFTNLYDAFTLGLKSYDSLYPGQSGCLFFGASTYNQSASKGATDLKAASGQMLGTALNGTTIINASNLGSSSQMQYPDASLSSNYAAFYGVRFVMANKGLATQTVSVYVSRSNPVADVSTANLLSLMNTFTVSGTVLNMAWNNGSTAYALPDCFFVRAPFYNNRLRLSSYRLMRVS